MASREKVQDVYGETANKLSNFRSSEFYLVHKSLSKFESGFEAIAQFMSDRPLMAVSDVMNKEGMLLLLDKEWYEAQHAIHVEGKSEVAAELGDTIFFALLSGMLFWDEMSIEEREFVDKSINWSMKKGSIHHINLVDSVVYVASKKDPINYPAQFYQLFDDETIDQAKSRMQQIGKLNRELRSKLNGEWKQSYDLIKTLANHWFYGDMNENVELQHIERLFAIAGIDLLANIVQTDRFDGNQIANKEVEVEGRMFRQFDQLNPILEFMTDTFKSNLWQKVVEKMRKCVIERLIPASENGVRNIAVAKFAEIAGLDVITIPGSDRELSWAQFLSLDFQVPDLIEYQKMVAWSKHNRMRRMSEAELERIGVFTDNHIESRTAVVAFDTIIQIWDGKKYVRGEKPESEEEAIKTITAMVSGEPFLVSTVSRVQNLLHNNEAGSSATILPVRIVTKDRFERAELLQKMIDLYRSIARGGSKPWKMTPAGASLMHPLIQPYLEIGIGASLEDNVLPSHFNTYELIEKPGPSRKDGSHKNIGSLAYKRFADSIVRKGGYYKMNHMSPELMQSVGMIFSGYSDIGMLKALERYLAILGKVRFRPIAKYFDRNLVRLVWSK